MFDAHPHNNSATQQSARNPPNKKATDAGCSFAFPLTSANAPARKVTLTVLSGRAGLT
jgi:hypothetical protein